MKVDAVKECSAQLKKVLAEQHNALDARVRRKIEVVIEALDAAVADGGERSALYVLLSIVNLLRTATNIADLISKIRND